MNNPLALLVITAALLLTSACSTLPPVQDKLPGQAAAPTSDGTLAELAARVAAGLAADESAFLLVLEHVLAAADRGVKVRLLVDDMFLSTGGAFEGADAALAAIDHHPNIELRLFNPGKYRSGIMGLAGNFGGNLKTYNRRMHNKLMIFDGRFAILGGRNIGDEYFGLYEHHNFLDLDVLATGPVTSEASLAYDQYWNADLAYPAGSLQEADDASYRTMRTENRDFLAEQAQLLASYQPEQHDWPHRLDALATGMHTGFGVFLQDEPVQRGDREYRLYSMLDDLVTVQGSELIISTPYLIPVGGFLQHIAEDVGQGVAVQILTNSLASNDATAAHSHYKKYRRDLLATGAGLYEFNHQPGAELRDMADVPPPRGQPGRPAYQGLEPGWTDLFHRFDQHGPPLGAG